METFFPHLTSTGEAPTSRTILSAYRHAFNQEFSRGNIRPLVLPYDMYGLFILIAYLSIPHKNHPWVYAARWPVLGFITWFQWQSLWKSSSTNYCLGYWAGLMTAWVIVWSGSWLVFMRPQWDAKRVQRIKVLDTHIKMAMVAHPNMPDIPEKDEKLIYRKAMNGYSKFPCKISSKTKTGEAYRYFWQSYPDNLKERIPWTIDLILNFRGPGWNWAISTLPSLPPDILMQLGEPVPIESYSNVSSVGLKRFNTRRELWRSRSQRLVFGYFLLDFMKVLMMKDPYYKFGPTTYALPVHLQPLSSFSMHIYRQILSSSTIIACLSMLNYLPPLAISILCGPRIFGLRAEAWYYPSAWGPFSNVFYKGIGGLWGNYWHQTFRLCFIAPCNYLIQHGIIKRRSSASMIIGLVIAFGMSGFIHWAGSVSIYANTYPSHLLYFFALQGLGIMLQSTLCNIFKSYIKGLPKHVRYTGNLIVTLIWLFSTGWILADDFARGGLWLWEPIPFSLFRGLGFGEPDAGWWCWEHIGIGWYTGKHWWESGITL